MKIVIDGRLWSQSGIGRYIRNLVHELQGIDGAHGIDESNEYHILLLEKDFKTVNFSKQNFHKVLADFSWYNLDEQIRLPGLLKELKPDLVHFPHFNVPVLYEGKYVVTIHDLIHQHHQTRETTTLNPLFHAVKKIGYHQVFNHAVTSAKKIITPSQFIKEQLQKEWGVKGEKIVVTHEGVDEGILRVVKGMKEKDFLRVADKLDIKKPYLFYVGNAQPYKNISKLIEAYLLLKEKNPDLSLVLSGPPHHFWERIKGDVKGSEGSDKGKIIFTGFVSDEELVVLYKNAEAFVMPSLEEGFGIPILEAMACGCPVVSSDAASLPEVGGEAVLYFNPASKEDLMEKVSEVLQDSHLRQKLIKKGEKRYKDFSWAKMAKETLKVYHDRD